MIMKLKAFVFSLFWFIFLSLTMCLLTLILRQVIPSRIQIHDSFNVHVCMTE